jgi:type II secretory pathway component GspD/PulD (secretin)
VSAGGSTSNSITQIGEQGTVSLDVKQEVNDIGENEPSPINSPRIKKRDAETSVVLLNNQTLILGWLIQNKRTKIRAGIRFRNRIPVLGYLFGSTEEKIEGAELPMLITPRMVRTVVDPARITKQMRRGARPRSSSLSSWLPRSRRQRSSHCRRRPRPARGVSPGHIAF